MQLNAAQCSLVLFMMIQYSSEYLEMTVENGDLCSPTLRKTKIKLDKGPHSGLIVTQTRLSHHPLDWNVNSKCSFKVTTATSQEGIIAVIQHLIFRKNSTNDECIDYVQFFKKSGPPSQKYCGRFNAALYMDHIFDNPEQPIASGTAYVDTRGELDVTISVSREHLKEDEEFDFSIVFTAYKNCSQVSKRDSSYAPCSKVRKEYCIYSGFFQDSYINCPLPDCEDENGCSKPSDVMDYYYGNKVLIGAVSSVFVVFALFILCLWICKTYKIFCWSQSFASPNTPTPQNPGNETPRVIEMNEQAGPRSSASRPTSASVNQVEEDKDLPPSYESLFPSR